MAEAPGTRLATWSLVCAAAVVPMYLVAYGIGALLMATLDVAEGDSLTTAGPAGWVAGLALVVLLPAPQAVGLRLGVRARRTGGRGRAIAGIIANAAIGGFLLASGLAGLLGS
ncbi:MAG: hypothetical protein ACKO7U_06955 [Actinomycetota bacterium]